MNLRYVLSIWNTEFVVVLLHAYYNDRIAVHGNILGW